MPQLLLFLCRDESCTFPSLPSHLHTYHTSFWHFFIMLAEMEPAAWEGAAYQMGNTPATWQAHYNPQHRMRTMQGAVETNATFTERMRRGQDLEIRPIMVARVQGRKRRAE